jgi:hypothetical protein
MRVLLLTLALPLAAQDLTSRVVDLLGVPYVEDAAEDAQGRCVTFARPDAPLKTQGLNCSGFVVAAARRLLGFRGDLAAASKDRLGDSGPSASLGQDWDFGWDLVLNLSEGRDRAWLTPEGPRPVMGDARSNRGMSVHDEAAWVALAPRLRPDRVTLVVFNRVQGGRLRHHHVGLILRQGEHLWFYQTLPKGRGHRLDLSIPEGLARWRKMFGPAERMRLLEVAPEGRQGRDPVSSAMN